MSTAHCVLANNAKAGIAVNAAGAIALINDDTIVENNNGLVYGTAHGSIISTKTNAVTQNTNNSNVPSGTAALE